MPVEISYIHTPELIESLSKLNKSGGSYQKAASRVLEILGKISTGIKDPLKGIKTTHHGEKRIKNCIKYDLSDGCRLVTQQYEKCVFLLFAGKHKDVDKWLDKNRGLRCGIDITKNTLVKYQEPYQLDENKKLSKFSSAKNNEGDLYLIEKLDISDQSFLASMLISKVMDDLRSLTIMSTDEDILNSINTDVDDKTADFLMNLVLSLRDISTNNASQIIRKFKNQIEDIEGIEGKKELPPGQEFKKITNTTSDWAKKYKFLVESANFKEWMLFTHPDQDELIEAHFQGAAKLLGVSGSGKTCVIVKRAIYLAEQYPDKKTIIITLNQSLSALIRELVDYSCEQLIAKKIKVSPFSKICQELLHQFEPGSEKLYSDITWKSEEHIDSIWQEFYRCDLNNYDASIMHPIHDSLLARKIEPEKYIREEFDWIRSAISGKDRDRYLELNRVGRSIPLQKQSRRLLIDGLSAWEEKMQTVGVIDDLGLVVALQPHLEKISSVYDSILVDESQDFGSSELDIIRRLVKEGSNDIFLSGDAAQQVTSKYQDLPGVGINLSRASTRYLNKNYRNSKQILGLAYKIFYDHCNEFHMDSKDFEVLDPEFSSIDGPMPMLLSANSFVEEINFAFCYCQKSLQNNNDMKICIAISGYSLYEIQRYGLDIGYPVLDGSASIDSNSIYLSDLSQTKGFEFDLVILLNACNEVLPNPTTPAFEQARDLSHFYVAMTRAKNQLIVSYHDKQSYFLDGKEEYVYKDGWHDYLDGEYSNNDFGQPVPVSETIKDNTMIPVNIFDMDGNQFLYTDHAIGLDVGLIKAIRSKIGETNPVTGEIKQAPNIAALYRLLKKDSSEQNIFGRKSSEQFISLIEKIGFN